MERKRKRRLIVLGTLAGLMLSAGAAQGSEWDRHSLRGHHTRVVSHYGYERAGTLYIDGARFDIDSRGNVGRSIARAFKRCGYDVRYERGCLRVCGDGYRLPRVKWRSDRYSVRFSDDCDELIVRWSKIRTSSCITIGSGSWHFSYDDRRKSRRSWRSRRWCD